MAQCGLASKYACPGLPALASGAIREIEKLKPEKSFCFVGSSLGGFYATHFAEKYGAKAVLINPAIDPHIGLRAYLGPQTNLHTGDPYELTEAHLREWEAFYAARITLERYLLIVETGDEVLDYRKAVKRYVGAEQIVIPKNDHSLQSFPEHLPSILRFAGLRA